MGLSTRGEISNADVVSLLQEYCSGRGGVDGGVIRAIRGTQESLQDIYKQKGTVLSVFPDFKANVIANINLILSGEIESSQFANARSVFHTVNILHI